MGTNRSTSSGCPWAGSSPSSSPTRHPAGSAGSCWPPPGPASSGWAGFPAHHAPCWRWPPAAATSSPGYYRRVAGDLYGGAARTDPDALLHGSLARFSQAPSLRGYLGQLYAISFWTGIPWLRRLRQPTLVLTGDDDPIVPALNGRILAHFIPDSRLHVVPGGGHLFLLERPPRSAGTWPISCSPTTFPPVDTQRHQETIEPR